ncbi:MAG: hypothetical protein JO316_25660 [Abitibacteriaceae bacterium]|nr:hypothetical protein [Abditibacteriaceae bacterium]
MWDEPKKIRFEVLRQRELAHVLTEAEQVELTGLIQEIEAAEDTYMTPATAKLRHERETLEAQNLALQTLLQRKQELRARLHATLTEATQERRNIDAALAHILGKSLAELEHTG